MPTFSGDAKGSWFVKYMGQSFGLLCQAQGFPVPAFRYGIKHEHVSIFEVNASGREIIKFLIIREADILDF